MGGQWDFGAERRGDGSLKWLPVNIDFPAGGLDEFGRKIEFGEPGVPDGEKVVEGQVAGGRGSLDMNDSIAAMSMHPIKATTIGGDANAFRDGDMFAIDVDREMGMNVERNLLIGVAGDAINRRIGSIVGDDRLDLQVDKAHEAEQYHATANGTPENSTGTNMATTAFLASLAPLSA